VLAGQPLAAAGLYAVPAPGRPKLRRVRALIDHLTRTFGPEPPWAIRPPTEPYTFGETPGVAKYAT
jgi:hypothetical protein